MDEPQRIEQGIAAQENLRGTVGDEIVDETISMLREKLAQLETPSESLAQHRKLVTILYTDIVGSTNIVKHLDPEDALEIMDGSLKRLAIPVEEHGGHIARFAGDGFKAVFGMPKAHENDPEMAVKAGLGILEVAQELGGVLGTRWGIHDFQVRVDINTGLVALGGKTEAEDTVMGSIVNLAKRVESAASPGGLLISHNTYRHVRGVFDVEPRFPMRLVTINSAPDGEPVLAPHYAKENPFPWPYIFDELRPLDSEAFLGMTYINVGAFRKVAFPFLLESQEYVDGL